MVEAIEIAFLVGRVLFGGFFVMNGVNHLANREQMTAYAEAKGTPAPGLSVVGSGVVILLGGLSVLLGLLPRVGLALIAVFLLVVSPTMHDYWNVEDPNERMSEQTQFMKNVALLGATIAFFAFQTPWALALGL